MRQENDPKDSGTHVDAPPTIGGRDSFIPESLYIVYRMLSRSIHHCPIPCPVKSRVGLTDEHRMCQWNETEQFINMLN